MNELDKRTEMNREVNLMIRHENERNKIFYNGHMTTKCSLNMCRSMGSKVTTFKGLQIFGFRVISKS